jgi:hypothetical protein
MQTLHLVKKKLKILFRVFVWINCLKCFIYFRSDPASPAGWLKILRGCQRAPFPGKCLFIDGVRKDVRPESLSGRPSRGFSGFFDAIRQSVKKSYHIWGSKIAPGTTCWGFGLRVEKKGNRFGTENQYQINTRVKGPGFRVQGKRTEVEPTANRSLPQTAGCFLLLSPAQRPCTLYPIPCTRYYGFCAT